MRKPEEFYRFYRNKMLFPNAEPNRAHKALAKLEEMGKLKAVVTQNIDGLHQKGGQQGGFGAPWFCTAELLHTLWKVLWTGCNLKFYRSSEMYLRRNDQAGCGPL